MDMTIPTNFDFTRQQLERTALTIFLRKTVQAMPRPTCLKRYATVQHDCALDRGGRIRDCECQRQ
jgi:hypothetical protein